MTGRLRVVQLNVGSLLEPDWDLRRHEVAAWVRELEPDIVCLEEIWEDATHPNTAAAIATTLDPPWHHRFGGAPFAPGRWPEPTVRFGSAILSRWPIDEWSYHRLPVGPDADGFVSGVPWELVRARTAGLDVFACHLAAAPTDGLHRRLQVLEIDAIIRASTAIPSVARPPGRQSPMPPILCGDFNAEPDSDEIRFLTSLTPIDGRTTFFQDAWRAAGRTDPGFTNDWTTHPLAAALNVHRKRIDYVFVGDPFLRQGGAGRVLAADLAFHTPRTGVQASDHCGLVVDIAWPTVPPRPDHPRPDLERLDADAASTHPRSRSMLGARRPRPGRVSVEAVVQPSMTAEQLHSDVIRQSA